MDLLLDTHTLIWFLNGDENISTVAKDLIINEENNKFISIASFWEISIKVSLNKLDCGIEIDDFPKLIITNGFNWLPIEPLDILQLYKLPLLHNDPFDRIMIAQSIINDLKVVTKDRQFAQYLPLSVIW